MKTTHQHVIATVTVTLFACVSAYAVAEPISGTTSGSYTKQQPVPIANADGNMLLAGEFHGKNKSTSNNGYMDGASVTNQEIAQLTQGNGQQAGYFTLAKDGSSTVAKWNGQVTTVMQDGKPMTTFKGKWNYVSGTGKYAGIQGAGDYTGYFTAQDSYVIDWNGDYSLGE